MPGPSGLVAALLLALQQLLKGPAASCRMSPLGPLLLGLGPVATSSDFNKLALKLLEPAALLIAFLGQEQVAAVGADLLCTGAAAEADWAVLDRDRDALPPAPAGQVPLPLVAGQAVAMGVADVIEDHCFLLTRRGT